jgi:hypothetical protein
MSGRRRNVAEERAPESRAVGAIFKDRGGLRIIIVGASNADPYPEQDVAIAALGAHFGITLDRLRCFPYGREGA